MPCALPCRCPVPSLPWKRLRWQRRCRAPAGAGHAILIGPRSPFLLIRIHPTDRFLSHSFHEPHSTYCVPPTAGGARAAQGAPAAAAREGAQRLRGAAARRQGKRRCWLAGGGGGGGGGGASEQEGPGLQARGQPRPTACRPTYTFKPFQPLTPPHPTPPTHLDGAAEDRPYPHVPHVQPPAQGPGPNGRHLPQARGGRRCEGVYVCVCPGSEGRWLLGGRHRGLCWLAFSPVVAVEKAGARCSTYCSLRVPPKWFVLPWHGSANRIWLALETSSTRCSGLPSPAVWG